MSRYPGALWKPVAYTGLKKRKPYRAAILHTNGSKGTDLFGWWSSRANGSGGAANRHVGAQYQVLFDGTVYCYVDPDLTVYHAFSASEWAIGIETQDGGNPNTLWTAAQLASIVAILRHHDVPPVLLSGDGPAHGVGYHELRDAWNHSKHACPGKNRESQIPRILAALAGGPVPQQPAPAPTPVVAKPPQEDPDMVIVTANGMKLLLLASGKVAHLSPDDYAGFLAAGVKENPKPLSADLAAALSAPAA